LASVQRDVARLVKDEEMRSLQLGELGGQLAQGVCFAQIANQVVEGRVADQVAARQRLHRDPHREMALAYPGRPEDQSRHLALDESQDREGRWPLTDEMERGA
jgi:hypothetical protein